MQDLKFKPLGSFFDNRAHGCYAGFYGEEEYSVASTVAGAAQGRHQHRARRSSSSMDGMTATRNRFRGVWLRPTWFVVKDGRFATNRENVSLVTSGGIDGNAPGVWALLEDSVIAGVSQNNVERFGPCPTDNELGINTGGQFGCIDHIPPSVKVCATGHQRGEELQTGWGLLRERDGVSRLLRARQRRRGRPGLSAAVVEHVRLHALRWSGARLRRPLRQLPQGRHAAADGHRQQILEGLLGEPHRRHRAALHRRHEPGQTVRARLGLPRFDLPEVAVRLRGRRRAGMVPVEPEQLSDRHGRRAA